MQQRIYNMETKWTAEKYSLLDVYLAKLIEVVSFMNKTRHIYNLNICSQQTGKYKQ